MVRRANFVTTCESRRRGAVVIKILAVAWERYERDVLAGGTHVPDPVYTRDAFYAGATVLFGAMHDRLSHESGEPTMGDVAVMEGLLKEMREYATDVRRRAG